MTMKTNYQKDEFTVKEYVIRCSEHELNIIRICLISALNTFEELEYTKEQLNSLVENMTLKEIDKIINVLFEIPF